MSVSQGGTSLEAAVRNIQATCGSLRDGRRKRMLLYADAVHFDSTVAVLRPWSISGLLCFLFGIGSGEMPLGYSCRYPHIQRVWIEGHKFHVQSFDRMDWLRFRSRDRAEAERCRRFIEQRLAPVEEIPVCRRELQEHPERYHGRRVRLTAWVRREFEGSFLIWDREEYLANRFDPLGRKLTFSYEVKDQDGLIQESGRQVRLMPNPEFMRTWVSIRASRQFLEVAGRLAQRQARISPPAQASGWVRRAWHRVSEWYESRLACAMTEPNPDDAVDLRLLEGIFGPMVLSGIFEVVQGRVCESILTVCRVRPVKD